MFVDVCMCVCLTEVVTITFDIPWRELHSCLLMVFFLNSVLTIFVMLILTTFGNLETSYEHIVVYIPEACVFVGIVYLRCIWCFLLESTPSCCDGSVLWWAAFPLQSKLYVHWISIQQTFELAMGKYWTRCLLGMTQACHGQPVSHYKMALMESVTTTDCPPGDCLWYWVQWIHWRQGS